MLGLFKKLKYPDRALDLLFGDGKWKSSAAGPTILNLKANDICNSRCIMCNIWEQKLEKQLSPVEIGKVLRNPYFRAVRYVGISGGEPTLRKDFVEWVKSITDALPALASLGIITNGIQDEKIFDHIKALNELFKERSIAFNVMVSLDGVGPIHDQIRGRKGNFESSVKLINNIKTLSKVALTLGTTVVKQNVFHLNEIFEFAKADETYIRFRIGEFIDHLYNNNCKETIRNFSDLERYNIYLFFDMLEKKYEKDPKVRATYRSIIDMIYKAKPRSAGCTAHSIAVHLNHKGELAACAPKGRDIISGYEREKLIKSALTNERVRLKAEACNNCIHDYHSYKGLLQNISRTEFLKYRIRLSLPVVLLTPRFLYPQKAQLPKNLHLVVGWYGTETAGDKAILATVLEDLRSQLTPGQKIVLVSLNPYLSEWTLRELGFKDVDIIPAYSAKYLESLDNAVSVTIGGGPLLHIDALALLLEAFRRGKRNGAFLRVFGCGIGPLDRGLRYQKAVKQIMQLADEIRLRDQASMEWLEKNKLSKVSARAKVSEDPAQEFVRKWRDSHRKLSPPEPERYIACFLRDLPREYYFNLSNNEFSELNKRFNTKLAQFLNLLSEDGKKLRFYSMHNFHVGEDDRQFNIRLVNSQKWHSPVIIESTPLSPQQIFSAMQNSALNVCMRFHSVVFSYELNPNFVILDYTRGAKIKSFANDHKLQQPLLDTTTLASLSEDELKRLAKKFSTLDLSLQSGPSKQY